jgi:hypothetical protein
MNRVWIISLIFGVALAAQVAEPRIGFARLTDGTIIDIRGVSGSFVVDRTSLRADAAAWSGRLEVSLTDAVLTISNAAGETLGNLDNSAGAVFGFSADGESVAVFRPGATDLSVWRAGSWTTTPVRGAIQSVAVENNRSVIAAIMRDSGTVIARIRLRDGAIEDEAALDSGSSPILVLPGARVIFAEGEGLSIRKRDGSCTHVDISGKTARLAALGDGWVHIVTADGENFALRLGDSPTVSAIPEPQQ